MYFFVPRDEVYRHKILKTLVDREMVNSVGKSYLDCKEIAVNADELSKILKVSVDRIKLIVGGLIVSEDVQRCETTEDRFLYVLAHKGYPSYIDNTYLKRGRAYRLSLIKDNLYIIVSFIAIISSIGSLWLYTTNTLHTQKEVEQLRKEVQEIKGLLYPKVQKTK